MTRRALARYFCLLPLLALPFETRAFETRAEDPRWRADDWTIFEVKVRRALEKRIDELPFGEAMVNMGLSFLGTPYEARTLDRVGDSATCVEQIVINFRELDCFTFVENVFSLVRFAMAWRAEFGSGALPALAQRRLAEIRYETLLEEMRYRNGVRAGYTSRLHYVTEWVQDNARRGLVRDMTHEFGGVRSDRRIDFMTGSRENYPQLSGEGACRGKQDGFLKAMTSIENEVSGRDRYFIPEGAAIGDIEDRISDGDIIAATTALDGLDVVHVGIAVWRNGALRLLHTPSTNGTVRISKRPLAERVLSKKRQNGIMVIRPTGGAMTGENMRARRIATKRQDTGAGIE